MKYPFLFLAVTLISLLDILSCSDEPSSIGIDLLGGDFITIGTFDTVAQSSSFYKEIVPLGLSSRILIGKRENTEASALMRFVFAIPDSLEQDFLDDVIIINQSFIELTPIYTFTDESAAYDFTVHKINNTWSSTSFTIDSLSTLSYDEEDVSSNKNFTDSIYTFDLSNNLISNWIKSSIDTALGNNFGIFYKPTITSGKVVGFNALTTLSSNAAKLRIVIEKPGVFIDTLNGFIIEDVSIVDSELPVVPTGEIAVQASTTIQSKIFFDLSALPKDIIINKAELFLEVDILSNITGSSFTSSLAVLRIKDSTTTTLDDANRKLLTKDNNVYAGEITSFISQWITSEDNQGIVIQSVNLTEGLELFAIKGSDFPVADERPRIKIIYTSKEN